MRRLGLVFPLVTVLVPACDHGSVADPERSAAVARALESCFNEDPAGAGVTAEVVVTAEGRWVSARYDGITDQNRAVQTRCEESVRSEFGLT